MVGVAEPTVAGPGDEQPPLAFDAHELVTDLWAALVQSVEGQFFSTADWQRARLEMWHADKLVRSGQPTANQWARMQHGLDELLVSPAVKRRAGIELRKHAADADEDAAVSLVGRYRQALNSVLSIRRISPGRCGCRPSVSGTRRGGRRCCSTHGCDR